MMRTQCFEIPSGKAGEEAEEKAEGEVEKAE